MEKEEIVEAASLENRISQMKSQFQESYDVFIRANKELSKISFDPSSFSVGDSLGVLSKLDSKDVNEILKAGSLEDCLSSLRSKIRSDSAENPNTCPVSTDVTKLLSIMNGLQDEIDSLSESQKKFSKLSADVDQEMSLYEKRMQDSIDQLDKLDVKSPEDLSSKSPDELTGDEEEDEETFDSDSLSD